MIAPRIFICHDLDLYEEGKFEVHIFKQLCQKLQKVHAEIVMYPERASVDGFMAFFLQHIATCQWFLLFQTESVLEVTSVQNAVSLAKMRAEQEQMQGIARFIALPGEAVETPTAWSTLLTFGATQDYQRALERLVLALSLSLDQEEAVLIGPVTSPLAAVEVAHVVLDNQQGVREAPLLAPSPPVADLITAPLPAIPVYKNTEVDPPALASSTPVLMFGSDQPVKLPLRVSKVHMVFSAVLASVVILGALIFTVVLPLHASGPHPSGGNPPSTLATAGIWPTANGTATIGAQASSTASAQGTAAAQGTATALAQGTVSARGTATASAQATASTPQGLYVITTRNVPAAFDPLTGPGNFKWDELTFSGGGSCGYTGGSYHAIMPQTGFFASCMAEATNYGNFLYQVRMTVLSGGGNDGGGLIFRTAGSVQYRLRIGIDGSYDLVTPAKTLASGSSSAIKTGLGQANLVAVAARGSAISVYINKVLLVTLTDSTSGVGKIGLMGVDFSTTAVNVAFSNAQIWLL